MSKPINTDAFVEWLEYSIETEREGGDMYGHANGMERVLQYVRKRNAYWAQSAANGPDLTVRHQKRSPLLEGSYDVDEGLGDAVSAVVRTFIDAWSEAEGAANLRITIEWEE